MNQRYSPAFLRSTARCDRCGEPFQRTAKVPHKRFCSSTCRDEHWKLAYRVIRDAWRRLGAGPSYNDDARVDNISLVRTSKGNQPPEPQPLLQQEERDDPRPHG